jgi:hypothetical protein
MWWLVHYAFPERYLDVWVLLIGLLFWLGLCTLNVWFWQQITGMILWTDILNMVLINIFDANPVWWAYGWTVSMIPILGTWWITPIIWGVCVMMGTSYLGLGFNI